MTLGRLVPDELVISMLLQELDAAGPGGFLLDGFPRTTAQAYALDRPLGKAGRRLTAALFLDAPDAVIVERLSGRLTCPRGHVFNARTQPPARPGVCDHDGEPLSVHDDDRAETVRRRLDVYHEVTEPLVGYYEERGVLHSFNGLSTPDAVSEAIRGSLGLAPATRFSRTPSEAVLVHTPGARGRS